MTFCMKIKTFGCFIILLVHIFFPKWYLLPSIPKVKLMIPHIIIEIEKLGAKLFLYSSVRTNMSVVWMKHLRNPRVAKVLNLQMYELYWSKTKNNKNAQWTQHFNCLKNKSYALYMLRNQLPSFYYHFQ